MFKYSGILCCLCAIFGCADDEYDTPLSIQSEIVLDSIPSGSGLVIDRDSAYIVGDDATSVYILNLQDFSYEKIPISGMPIVANREARSTKHDFECSTIVTWVGKKYLLAFGSGSQIESRDSLLMLAIHDNNDQRIISLKNFYKAIQDVASTDSTQWNLEAATVMAESLILCNRGNNLIIELNVSDFLSFLLVEGSVFPKVLFHRARLPRIENKEARLSGASTLNDSVLLFSASVEDTQDWTKDGPVLGSFIMVYSIRKFEFIGSYLLQDESGNTLKEKLESVDILNKDSQDRLIVLALADNDNGSSKLFRLRLDPQAYNEAFPDEGK